MMDWRLFLCESPHPGGDPVVDLKRLAWLRNSSSRTLDLAQNRGGECGFNYPVIDEYAQYMFKGTDYCIEARCDDDIVWTGPLATNQGQAQSSKQGTISIKAVGWLELLTARELHEDVTYGATNPTTSLPWTDAEIIWDLLARVIAYDPAHAPPIRQGIAYGTRYNRQKKWQKGTKIEQCFRELVELEAGINIEIDPATRKLNIYSWDFYADHANVVYGFNKPPYNIESFEWQQDKMGIRNRLLVNGAPGTTPALAIDDASQDEFGIFEETINLTDVQNNETLLYYANAELVVKSVPTMHYSFTPKSWAQNMPKPLIDYKIGDMMRLSVDYGPIQELARPVRCYGLSLAIDKGTKITAFKTTVSG